MPLSEAEKIAQAKRDKAQAKQQPKPRPLNDDERHFVESYCVHMRPIEQAMFIYGMSKTLDELVKDKLEQKKSGLVKPDGSKL